MLPEATLDCVDCDGSEAKLAVSVAPPLLETGWSVAWVTDGAVLGAVGSAVVATESVLPASGVAVAVAVSTTVVVGPAATAGLLSTTEVSLTA